MLSKSTVFQFIVFSICLPQVAWVAEPLSLRELLERTRDHNPEIVAARQAWLVTRSEVGAAKAWPNPTFTYIDEKDPGGMAGVEPLRKQHYNVQQAIPFPGKITSEARMKHHESRIAESQYRSKVLDVLHEARLRYYQLYLT